MKKELPHALQISLITALALIAFAANSLLCRKALGAGNIDPASFTAIRFTSGAVVLALLATKGKILTFRPKPDWIAVGALFLYSVPFSVAYLSLKAGTGALILFGCVQLTMIGTSVIGGSRPSWRTWVGLAVALAGMVYLVLPGVAMPDPMGAALMGVAGCGWGVYSLRGKKSADPLANTVTNFVFVAPLTLVVVVLAIPLLHWNLEGILIAVFSGVVASGLGYVAWYKVLQSITAFTAATVQLAVPVIAAAGGILFLSEATSWRLLVSTVAILGGILVVLVTQARSQRDC